MVCTPRTGTAVARWSMLRSDVHPGLGRRQALEPEVVLTEVPPVVHPLGRLLVLLVRHGLRPPCTAAETALVGWCGLHTV